MEKQAVDYTDPRKASMPEMNAEPHDQFSSYFNQQKKLIDEEAHYQDQAALAMAKVNDTQMTALQAAQTKKDIIESERRRFDQQSDLKIANAEREADKLKDINPNRIWHDMGTGKRILAGISIFLGGLGGGENHALGIIKDAINRDVMAQKDQHDRAEKKGERLMNMYSFMRKRFNDELRPWTRLLLIK